MTNEVSVKLACVQIRSGVEIWLEADRAEKLQDALENLTSHKFIRFEERSINTADIVGVFTAQDLADLTHRKNGEWKCKQNTWHSKSSRCECAFEAQRNREQKEFEQKYLKK